MWQLNFQPDNACLLVNPEAPHFKPFHLDFTESKWQRRSRQIQHELLLKALGKGKLTILDATIGLGRDAFIMASAGHQVTGIELSPLLFEFLNQAIIRARAAGIEAMKHWQLLLGDALQLIPTLPAFDVIYLDPMFPVRQKSALVKKEAQILQALGCHDEVMEVNLLTLARAHAKTRVVVKRPLPAPFLGGQAPHHQIVGKTVRFDVYITLGRPMIL